MTFAHYSLSRSVFLLWTEGAWVPQYLTQTTVKLELPPKKTFKTKKEPKLVLEAWAPQYQKHDYAPAKDNLPQTGRSRCFAILAKESDRCAINIDIISTTIINGVHHGKGKGTHGDTANDHFCSLGKFTAHLTNSELGQFFIQCIEQST